jgi:hypothetical protein
VEDGVEGFGTTDLDLAILPARYLNHGIDNSRIVLFGVKRYVVPERDGLALMQKPHSPVLSVSALVAAALLWHFLPVCYELQLFSS